MIFKVGLSGANNNVYYFCQCRLVYFVSTILRSSRSAPATCSCPRSVGVCPLGAWHANDSMFDVTEGWRERGEMVRLGVAVKGIWCQQKRNFLPWQNISFWRSQTMHTRGFSCSRVRPVEVGRDVWWEWEKAIVVFWNLSPFQMSCPYKAKLSP